MVLKTVIILLGLIGAIHAANFYPLPNNVTQHVFVVPFYGVSHMHRLDISHDGGSLDPLKRVLGIRLKIGDPFMGLSIQYEYTQGRSITRLNDYRKTTHLMDVFRLRYDKPLISDEVGKCVGFVSVGQLQGEYMVQDVDEDQGVTRQVERRFSAIVAEIGVSFVYQLNPQWHLFLEPSTQVSMSESNQNLLGDNQSGGTIDFTATSIRLGSTINL